MARIDSTYVVGTGASEEVWVKIKGLSVTKLFGVFDHTVQLKLADRITIIHGPNGFGKTVLLRMLDSLLNARYAIFARVPFQAFRVEFDDNTDLIVQQSTDEASAEVPRVTIDGSGSKGKAFNPFKSDRQPPRFPLSMIDELIPELDRTGGQEWTNRVTGQILSLEEILLTYPELPYARDMAAKTPSWLKKLQDSFHLRLIRSDRLLVRPTVRSTHYAPTRLERTQLSTLAVVEYSQELSSTIQQTLAKSVELSSSLDRSFPMRLVDHINQATALSTTEEHLRHELKELEEKRLRLTEAGLLDKEEANVQIPDQAVDPLTQRVLSIYVQDVQQKLQIFDELLRKIELLRRIINGRFLYKTFGVSKEKGFVLVTPSGSHLAPDILSSGEQNELVLLYELLFKVPPRSVVLIDEPEISLHIAWQQEFLNDLLEITQVSDFDVIIATHSPDIIHDRWDLTEELHGPENN